MGTFSGIFHLEADLFSQHRFCLTQLADDRLRECRIPAVHCLLFPKKLILCLYRMQNGLGFGVGGRGFSQNFEIWS